MWSPAMQIIELYETKCLLKRTLEAYLGSLHLKFLVCDTILPHGEKRSTLNS